MSVKGWIGVDLDGTLAMYEKFLGLHVIGEPIPLMVARVKKWVDEGREVKIMTARVSQSVYRPRPEDVYRTIIAIQDWCELHIGTRLEVTCIKTFDMTELWDDRAVQIVPNTGIRADVNRSTFEEQLEVLRRVAERGLSHSLPAGYESGDSAAVDLFQHLLDEIGRTKALLG